MLFVHLVKRFAGGLRPAGPAAADESWARSFLRPGEVAVWARMSGPDRRHAVGVARRVVASLGPDAHRPVVAAALLHDAGKVDSGLGTLGRVPATLLGLVPSVRRRLPAGSRLARYLRHPAIGADLLAAAGSDPLTIAWTREHHLPAERWSVPVAVGEALKAADDD